MSSLNVYAILYILIILMLNVYPPAFGLSEDKKR